MRRKAGTLVPLEESILCAAAALRAQGALQFYGLQIAQELSMPQSCRLGTIYRALRRLELAGLLTSEWEVLQTSENRPRRRFYSLSAEAKQGP